MMWVHHIITIMNKRLTTAFVVFSLIVFAFLIVWFVFRTINTRSDSIASARDELEKISKRVASTYLSAGSFTSTYFRQTVFESARGRDELRALVISTEPNGAEFAYAVSESYFASDSAFDNEQARVEFAPHAITEVELSTSAILPSGEDIRLDAVFRVFGRSEVFPIVRELLIGLLSFLLVLAIIIIAQPYVSKRIENAGGSTANRQSDESTTAARQPHAGPIDPPTDSLAPAEPSETQSVISASEPEPVYAGENESSQAAVSANDAEAGGLYSPDTGLVWEEYLEERLSAELKRAASFDQDLVLLLGCSDGLKRSDPFYAELARMAQEFFNFQDLCFEYGDGGIGIIIPNVDIDDGIERVESFKHRIDRRLASQDPAERFFSGLSARNGRLISGKRIIREAKSALRRAQLESTSIIAFRVDPEKYREYIATRKSSIQR